jgi:hypothetical protein
MRMRNFYMAKTFQGCKLIAPQTTISRVSEQGSDNLREQNKSVSQSYLDKYKGSARQRMNYTNNLCIPDVQTE